MNLAPLEEAIHKQRLLFMAIMGLNAPGIDCKLRDEEIYGLTGCISETISLIEQVLEADEIQSAGE
ncbi:MAG: hypothetical protein PHN92_02125 [Geobacter sp.]|nr:hypothetical protein [Geobacter sp.]